MNNKIFYLISLIIQIINELLYHFNKFEVQFNSKKKYLI